MKKEQEAKQKAPVFTKRQLVRAYNFSRVERDVLAAILEDDKQYTLDEVQKLLKDFKARRVQ
jgi:predicted transcriptional regulator